MPNSNRDKGLKSERDVAKWFRDAGIPTAERRVVTGWHRTDRSDPDLGDIKGVAGICVQVKNYSKPLTGKLLEDAMAETLTQCLASGCVLPLLIEKRSGHASPGEWWAWLPAHIFGALLFGIDPYTKDQHAWFSAPVRIELQHVTNHLVRFSRLCESEVA